MACIEIQRRIIPLDKEFNPENFDSLGVEIFYF